MILRFYRNSGSTTPATAENVELADDGSFTGWRSIAPSVGWFAGALPASDCDEVRTAIGALGDAVPGPPPPGSTVETLELPDGDPLVVTGVQAGGPLGDLVDRARRLLDEMVDSPRAAVGMDGNQLVHRGTDPIELDISAVALRATYWRGYYEPAGNASEMLAGQRVTAKPGWTLDLPSMPPPDGDDITTHLTVDFAIVANGNVIPVQAQHLPDIPEPT
jgi:hypothetical protein